MWESGVHFDTEEIFRIMEKYKELPAGEQTRLARLAQAGDTTARDQLILTNLRLVVNKVKPWSTYVDAADVIQEGIAGMCRAIDKYDPESGYVFSTYAVYWIQQAARSWKFRQNKLYVPLNVHEEIIAVQKCMKTGVIDPRQIAKQTKMALKHVEQAMKLIHISHASLDRKMSDTRESSDTLGYFIEDEHDHIADIEDRIDLERYMAVLNEREQQLIRLRFGFGEEDPLIFPEIGKRFGVTQQRIVQIYNKAIKKMQSAAASVAPKEVA